MDSSPDLTLKLRRGSSDSRDSFYMDFAQGIDSDIEGVDSSVMMTNSNNHVSLAGPPRDDTGSVTTCDESNDDSQETVQEPHPLPPIPPLPPMESYQTKKMTTKEEPEDPSTSPSPPPTPPPCPPLSVAPPPSPPHHMTPMTPPDSPSQSLSGPQLSSLMLHQFEHSSDIANNDDDSTTITTPPSNGCSTLTPPVAQMASNGGGCNGGGDRDDTKSYGNVSKSLNEKSTSIASATLSGLTVTHTDTSSLFKNESNQRNNTLTKATSSTSPQANNYPSRYDDHHNHLHHHQQQPPLPIPTQSTSLYYNNPYRGYHAPSMSSVNNLVSPETGSRTSSPVKSATSSRLRTISGASSTQLRVTIDESSLKHHLNLTTMHTTTSQRDVEKGGGGGGGAGSGDDSDRNSVSSGSLTQQLQSHLTNNSGATNGHLALMYHSHQLTNYPVLPVIKKQPPRSYFSHEQRAPKIKAGDALATLISALYGKLLVVMGIAFPMAEVISTYIPPSFYEVFYLYLYIGSMMFLFFMYATLLWGRPKIASPIKKSNKSLSRSGSGTMEESDTESNSTDSNKRHVQPIARRPSLLAPLGRQHHYGSFYLRMGAVAFGIGSMIYSGLEFGQYFELERDTKCHNVMLALTPATRMAFIFIQMYFIFLNNEQIKVYKHKIIARFGLMHMIGTNLAVWLNVLIQETKHEILTFYNPDNRNLSIHNRLGSRHQQLHQSHYTASVDHNATSHSLTRVARGLKGPYQIFECRRTNIIGTLVQDASPFLFPCTIEYSLICAAILYVMWRSISRPQPDNQNRAESTITSPLKRSPHHYSVDCARAHKGLFVGILILVLTIISLILFFVLISRAEFISLAVTEVTICELFIYATSSIATLIGMIQIRNLQYDAARSFELDDILLVGAQTGSFLYNTFTVIAGHFTLRQDTILILVNALASIVQTAFQTMFILDASRRQAVRPDDIRRKPGREIVTFMLVVNLAMWAISTLEKSRAESHPIQLNFYGLWAWTIITHVSMPLAIFYRFHSTVCLCEIWKRAYKLKPTYM